MNRALQVVGTLLLGVAILVVADQLTGYLERKRVAKAAAKAAAAAAAANAEA